jgi:tetratricopeptide (TPR) repeat protein
MEPSPMSFHRQITWLLLLAGNVAAAQNKPDCENKAFQDSLIVKYVEKNARIFHQTSPEYQLCCDSALAICSKLAYAWQQKSVSYMKRGMYEKGMEYLNKAVESNPGRWLAYRGFMKCVFMKDYGAALKDFEMSEKMLPGGYEMEHSYIFWLGICHKELGHLKPAHEYLSRCVDFNKPPGETHFNNWLYFGILNLQMKNYAVAEKSLKNCLAYYKKLPEANYYLALTYKATQKSPLLWKASLQKALEGYQEGFRLNEDNEVYVNYPDQISRYEIEAALKE